MRLLFGDGTRAVFRLSGTGSTGTTVRMYLEKYEADVSKQVRRTGSFITGMGSYRRKEVFAKPCTAPCVSFTQGLPSSEVLKPLADIAIKLARLEEFTGRTAPTVIT